MSNPLKESGKPLFFKVSNPEELNLAAPEPRHGQSVRLAVRSLSDMQKEALVINSLNGAVWRLASDEGAYLAGQDEAPCPLSFLTTGMVCSYMDEILALAKQRGITVRDIKLIQDNYYTMKGSALKGTMTGGAKNIDLEAQIDSDADEQALHNLVVDAVAASPLNGLMCGEKESYFSVSHNGREIGTGKANALGSPAFPDPGDEFDRARPAEGDWSGLIVRNGMTPETEETVTRAGGSLQAEQDRVLHVRGICTLREDGIKAVEQHLYNPHGSIFHFLCEEGPENGGKGRAPDAAGYISIGIGFCFMTQLGRYAKILKKDLSEYRIIQDTHFSLGGASGGTGKAGIADPVETHVYLTSNEDDDFAREVVDMGEQTCFLHAFCRTDLKARVRITAPEVV
ncbi:MAG: OsmC family peroxiredoxin [Gammaproteobacteria bacterium]